MCIGLSLSVGCYERIGFIPSDPDQLRTALFKAVKYDGPGRCKALIEAGAQVDARDQIGWTPLHYAINRLRIPGEDDIRTIKVLVEAETSRELRVHRLACWWNL